VEHAALVVVGLVAGGLLLARVPTVRRPAAGRRPGPPPAVSIVVPARNEERTLPVLLASLRTLDPAPHEVIVVDDSSTDATAPVAAAHDATVLAATSPPAGWAGKPWACHTGAEAATGTHLLFLDADTWLAPDALRRLLDEHAPRGGLLSVQPHHRTERAYEQLSAFFNVAAMMGTGAFAVGGAAPRAMAFGPCLLTTVADHRSVGGHAAVRGEVVEDVRLARAYRARGLPVRCVGGGDAVVFRMYPDGPGQLVEGWTKNIASGAGLSPPWALTGTVAWICACVAVTMAAAGGMWSWVVDAGPAPWIAVAAWAAVAVELGWMLGRIGTWRVWTAVFFPVPLAAFLAVFLRSLALTLVRGEVTWRARRVPVGARSRR
jgi:glycosyltransferase involved in cell wall biosynthesis